MFIILALVACTRETQRNEARTDWWAEVRTRLDASTYTFRADGDGFVAANGVHDLNVRFDGDGAHFRQPSGEWTVNVRVAAVGRGSVTRSVEPQGYALGECGRAGLVDPRGHCIRRLEGVRPGLVEWWENGPSGLEHGFIVEELDGEGGLIVDLDVQGATTSAEGASARFRIDEGRSLRYDGLVVTDATGRELDARMEPLPAGIRVVVDVANARWPVEVDPTVTTGWWAMDAESTTSSFGYDVSSAGDINGDGYDDVVVGAPEGNDDQGAVYVYFGSSTGPSIEADWGFEPSSGGAFLGRSVAELGDVNRDGYDDVAAGGSGYFCVFHGGASGPGVECDTRVRGEDNFGQKVAGAGDVNGDGYQDVIAGGDEFDGGQTNEGVVSLHLGTPSGISADAAWSYQSDQIGAALGSDVAGIGDVNGDGYDDVAVGASYYDDGQTDEGEVFLFLGSAAGLASFADWSYDADQSSAQLGAAIARAGDVNRDGYADLLLGARYYDGGESDEGRAWLFYGGATGLSVRPDWTLELDEAGAAVGASVAGTGDVDGDGYDDVIVSAPSKDVDGVHDLGEVRIFAGSATGLSSTPATVFRSSGMEAVGRAVAGAGDVDGDGYHDILISIYDAKGKVFLLAGGPDGVTWRAPWETRLSWGSAAFGYDISAAGDVNGDGLGDVIVGDGAFVAYVFHGSASGLPVAADTTLSGSTYAGKAVDGAGDVNGDGFDDVIVGASGYSDGETYEGYVRVYYGSPAGILSSTYTMVEGGQEHAYLGYAVAGVGDVDGDGFDDVAAGAYGYDHGETDEGRAYVFRGAAGGLDTSPLATLEYDFEGAALGASVAGAGDVNGDGFADLIVGAPLAEDTVGWEGGALVYLGRSGGLDPSPDWAFYGGQRSAACGEAVAGVGDLNGDGFDDVAVGCPDYDDGETDEGQVFVFLGSAGGPGTVAAWSWDADDSSAALGTTLHHVGDLNGDGYDDLALGAPLWDGVYPDQGIAWLFPGSPSGLPASPAYTFAVDGRSDELGRVTAGSGDSDGNGLPELLVGAHGGDVVYVYSWTDSDHDGEPSWTDCNDADAAIHSGSEERCDGIDTDCDGVLDPPDSVDAAVWYGDADGDGFGDPGALTSACTAPYGFVADSSDCDDSNADAHPGATETCNDLDEDCDGQRDEDIPTETWWRDADGDGLGDPAESVEDCGEGRGYVDNAEDCNDSDESVGSDPAWFRDADGDGYGDGSAPYTGCDAPEGYVPAGNDCDDTAASVHPGMEEEWYDGVDQNCDGNDVDQDGDGAPVGDDCDDLDPEVTECADAAGKEPPPCGCAAGGGSPVWLALAASLLVRARRGRSALI